MKASRLLTDGRAEEALPVARRAAEMDASPIARNMLRQALLANEAWDEWLSLTPASRAGHPDVEAMVERIAAEARRGRRAEAEQELASAAAALNRHVPGESATMMAGYLRGTLLYESGDRSAAAGAWAAVDASTAKFQAGLVRERWVEAAELLGEEAGSPWHQHLILAVLAEHAGEADLARAQRRRAAEQMKQMAHAGRSAAAWLEGDEPINAAALRVSLPPEEKRLVLAALGQMSAEHRAALFALAAKLNYAPGFPRRELESTLSESRK